MSKLNFSVVSSIFLSYLNCNISSPSHSGQKTLSHLWFLPLPCPHYHSLAPAIIISPIMVSCPLCWLSCVILITNYCSSLLTAAPDSSIPHLDSQLSSHHCWSDLQLRGPGSRGSQITYLAGLALENAPIGGGPVPREQVRQSWIWGTASAGANPYFACPTWREPSSEAPEPEAEEWSQGLRGRKRAWTDTRPLATRQDTWIGPKLRPFFPVSLILSLSLSICKARAELCHSTLPKLDASHQKELLLGEQHSLCAPPKSLAIVSSHMARDWREGFECTAVRGYLSLRAGWILECIISCHSFLSRSYCLSCLIICLMTNFPFPNSIFLFLLLLFLPLLFHLHESERTTFYMLP